MIVNLYFIKTIKRVVVAFKTKSFRDIKYMNNIKCGTFRIIDVGRVLVCVTSNDEGSSRFRCV